jgi:hypothetical protein
MMHWWVLHHIIHTPHMFNDLQQQLKIHLSMVNNSQWTMFAGWQPSYSTKNIYARFGVSFLVSTISHTVINEIEIIKRWKNSTEHICQYRLGQRQTVKGASLWMPALSHIVVVPWCSKNQHWLCSEYKR